MTDEAHAANAHGLLARDRCGGSKQNDRVFTQAGERVLWQTACRWIAANTPASATFLTPRFQQTFKWYAGRGEAVTWKDVPQDAKGIVEWRRRMEELYPEQVEEEGLVAHGEENLRRLAHSYGFQYVVIDRARSLRPLKFVRVFPEDRRAPYEVYQIPP